jgi:hypothetical protein
MKNYTTQTASLKATTIDTRILDTKFLNVNGESLEDVILQTAPKGINNAVKISTTIGSIKNGSTVMSGDYKIGLTSGMLWVSRVDGISGHSWQPVQVVLGGEVVLSKWERHVAGHWEMLLWEYNDDLSQIYGGVSDDDLVEVLIIIPEQLDGDEPVQTSLTGAVQHNVVYHLGEEANLNLTLPTSLIANYAAEVVFTSGATPTVVTSDSRIKWVGDDVNGGVFTPVANVRYSCSLQYDGVFVRGMTFGIPTV